MYFLYFEPVPMPLQIIASHLWGFMTPWLQDIVRKILSKEHPAAIRDSPFVGIHVRRSDKITSEHQHPFNTTVSTFMLHRRPSIIVESTIPGLRLDQHTYVYITIIPRPDMNLRRKKNFASLNMGRREIRPTLSPFPSRPLWRTDVFRVRVARWTQYIAAEKHVLMNGVKKNPASI